MRHITLMTLLVLVAALVAGCDSDSPTEPLGRLVADFTWSAQGLTVTFSDASSLEAETWFWRFGDGRQATLQNPVHSYAASGKYTVALTVEDGHGRETTTQREIEVSSPTSSAARIQLGASGDFGWQR